MTTDTTGPTVESVPQFVDEWGDDEFSRRLSAFKHQMKDLAKMARGNWLIPSEFRERLKEFHFIRLGTLSDVNRKTAILMNKALLEQQGWKEAPRGVRNAMFPHDQEYGVYMCMPRSHYRQWQDMHRELSEMSRKSYSDSRRKEIADQLEHGDGARLRIEKFDVERTTVSVADLMGENAEKAKRRK